MKQEITVKEPIGMILFRRKPDELIPIRSLNMEPGDKVTIERKNGMKEDGRSQWGGKGGRK